MRNGLTKEWSPRGELRLEKNYKNNNHHGLEKKYRNGNLWIERVYNGGSKETEKWYSEGKVSKEVRYHLGTGERISEKCWDENGKEIRCKW